MAKATIDKLIVNSPYEEPQKHWRYDRESRLFNLEQGRRQAGYIVATPGSKAFDDPGVFVPIELTNKIRPRVKAWREAGYPGASGITRRLLKHWNDSSERHYQFFFCQLEAIETLIWLAEAPDADKVGIDIPLDGGEFQRLCAKMATGSGKTVVMAMLIAWQVLNKVTYPQDTRFSKNIFIVAPGLTVKSRLEVLMPSYPNNFYDEFNVVPLDLWDKLRQGKVIITNWHKLSWESEEQLTRKRSVKKLGVISDEAYVREVLGDMSRAKNIVVINDEAHHAWRVNVEALGKYIRQRDLKDSAEEATVWVSGLDRVHAARGILNCYDFSATPFAPSGKRGTEEALFAWIVSDFGLNDSIESGLVKTPRVVIRDDGKLTKDYKSRLYHIYNDSEVKDNLNRKAEEYDPLPDLVSNAYDLLGEDWLKTFETWKERGHKTPPVMITVANRTETAARVKYAFDHKKIRVDELCERDKILHIDSRVLRKAEMKDEEASLEELTFDSDDWTAGLSKKELEEILRYMVDTVGKVGYPGEQIQNVISVGMLSEGWDAKTVTHIMGLRAFSSQLLCEQVVGRGLRRTSYEVNPETGLYDAEHVNIFGVPFTFLPHEVEDGPPPPPQPPKTKIEPVKGKSEFEIKWPNVIRIDHTYTPALKMDLKKVKPLVLHAYKVIQLAELAPMIEGKPDVTKISQIDLEKLGRKFRMQKIIFETASDVYDQMAPTWKGRKEYLLIQLIKLIGIFLNSKKVRIMPALFYQDDLRRRIVITLNMRKLVQHIWEAIRFENTKAITPIFNKDYPIRSTSHMRPWYTGKPCEHTQKSHINMCVFDSTWEATEAFELNRNPNVEAWVKNDHLGFEVLYVFEGLIRKYRPDFIIRLITGEYLVLETKGMDTSKDRTKRKFLDEWVKAVNQDGRFGKWSWAVSKNPADVAGIIEKNLI